MPMKVIQIRRWEAVLVVVGILGAVAIALALFKHEQNQRFADNAAIRAAVVMQSEHYDQKVQQAIVYNCGQIEKLKTGFRQQANLNYRNLARNAKLLGVALTRELRRQARIARDAQLRRYRSTNCAILKPPEPRLPTKEGS